MRLRSQFVCVGLSLAILALPAIDLHAWFGGGSSPKTPVPEASPQAEAGKPQRGLRR